MEKFAQLWESTGLYGFTSGGWSMAIMVGVGLLLLYLAIKKGFEPLLLIPIGFGCILANIPLAGITDQTPPQTQLSAFAQQEVSADNVINLLPSSGEARNVLISEFRELSKDNPDQKVFTDKTVKAFDGKNVEVPTKEFASYLLSKKTQLTAESNKPQLVWAFNNWNFKLYQKKLADWKKQKENPNSKPKKPIVYKSAEGFLMMIYKMGVATGLFPLLIFMGVGAMTDFGPLIANPRTALLGAAAQFGIFSTLIGALLLGKYAGLGFGIKEAASIGIIGGADGPTAIFTARLLAPELLGAIAVAAYSYMALVPIIQPPIMRLLTSKEERQIKMKQLRPVPKVEKIVFPMIVLGLCALLLPTAAPLIGALMFGNLAKESGVVDRLSDTMQNALINIVTILLGLAVGMKLAADKFLKAETLGILLLGLVAFSIGTASGILLAKLMNKFSKNKINPLIGAAGVSAVPMAARVANKVGLEENPQNFLLMHAMGPNVAGVIGSAVAAGVLITFASKM